MLFSVIIPAYNAEKIIADTLENIYSQKTKYDFEVIVINDGSKDGTEKILAEASKKYPNFRFESIENSGPSGARNKGIELANGKYILFCDSDDAFSPDAFEKTMDDVTENSPDFYIFGFEIIDENGKREKYHSDSAEYDKASFRQNFHKLYAKNQLNQVWGKVFRRDLIIDNEIKFKPYKWGEDRFFVFDYINYAEKISCTEDCRYEYIQTKGSLISSFCKDKFEVCTEIDKRARALGENDPDAKKIFDYMYVKSVISCFTMLFSKKCPYTHKEKRNYIKASLEEKNLASPKEYPENSGILFKILAKVIATENISLIMIFSYLTYFASENLTSVFRHSKHKMNGDNK